MVRLNIDLKNTGFKDKKAKKEILEMKKKMEDEKKKKADEEIIKEQAKREKRRKSAFVNPNENVKKIN